MPFDVLIRGGLLVDGTGGPARPADVGILGDRILAVGDPGTVATDEVRLVIEAAGLVVTPGFIDPHGEAAVLAGVETGRLPGRLIRGAA